MSRNQDGRLLLLSAFPFGIGCILGLMIGMYIVMARQDVPIQRLQKQLDRANEAAETCLFGAPQTQ